MNKERKILAKLITFLGTMSLFFVVVSCNNTNPTSSDGTNKDGTVKDADGNIYHTVTIGTQTWTVENLRTTKYKDGTAIPLVTDESAWEKLRTPGYCFYNNTTSASEQQKWGALYNWYTVDTGRLAPAGWHVPTDGDWAILENYLIANGYNYDGSTTFENKIAKSLAAKTDWTTSTETGAIGNDLSANNRSGFSALPGGFRNYDGTFNYQSDLGRWWSASENGASSAYSRNLHHHYSDSDRYYQDDKRFGYSVRLVRD